MKAILETVLMIFYLVRKFASHQIKQIKNSCFCSVGVFVVRQENDQGWTFGSQPTIRQQQCSLKYGGFSDYP